nr:hypothetical protein [Streptosporangium amethystogenes]
MRTLREARTAATLRGHPGIVTVYDVVEEDGRPWIVMEPVEGPSMAEVLRAEGRLAETRVAEIGLRVISALAAAVSGCSGSSHPPGSGHVDTFVATFRLD